MESDTLAKSQSNVPISRYPKTDKGMNFAEWTRKKKPLVFGAPYFTEKRIGDTTYVPTQEDALIVNNYSSQNVCFGFWKVQSINKESLPNQENWLAYCFDQDAFLKGELARYDTSCCAYINQHIRVFVDVLGDSYNQQQDHNTLVKGTNDANTIDFPQGTGHGVVSALDNGSQSVLPAISAKVIEDSSLRPGVIIVQKSDNCTNLTLNVKFTQTGITLPTKYSNIDAGLQSFIFQHSPRFLFALYKADEPQREMIASKIFEVSLNQAVIITDSQQDPSSVDINVVSKAGCIAYLG